ncbi:efflux RND transporter periplasmic adaptor subunit [Rheinheimera baltica]|uniref:efflux RND transporter periplasmic adaptor subunit n=1 Tax=Rheinheimera baltica TaxID=67576 RepID=UPI000418ACB1|nr:efflux RND transporter periplasmic adaptor subunit [Rheinheimera baltica]
MSSFNYITDQLLMYFSNVRCTIVVILLFASLMLLQGCNSENTTELVKENRQLVLLNEVKANDYQQESLFPGITQTESRAQLAFGVSGKVHKVMVDIGSQLKAGEVMATMDLERYQLVLDSARSEVSKAQIALEEYTSNYERLTRLRSNKTISQQELEASRTLYLTAQASLRDANSKVQLAERDLAQAVIKAPYDGVVSSRQVEPFEEVEQNQVIFSFDSSAKLIVESSIPVYLAATLRSTKEPSITITHQGQSFNASVAHISARATNGVSLPIKLHLHLPDNQFLPPGVVVSVNYRLQNRENLILVPHGSVSGEATNESTFVYSYDSEAQIVSRRPVQIVDIQPSGYWISSDLRLGERYVAAGAAFISDGQHVRVSEEKH